MRGNSMKVVLVCLTVALSGNSTVSAMSNHAFSDTELAVANRSIDWFRDDASAGFTELQLSDYDLKETVLNSHFYSELSATTYGTLLDFIAALQTIAPFDKIQIVYSDLKRSVDRPYSLNNPLITMKLNLLVLYRPRSNQTLAYSFRFLYYSDPEGLQKQAAENNFPNTASMDTKTTLMILEEYVTSDYPGNFQRMNARAFNDLLGAPVRTIHDYINLRN